MYEMKFNEKCKRHLGDPVTFEKKKEWTFWGIVGLIVGWGISL